MTGLLLLWSRIPQGAKQASALVVVLGIGATVLYRCGEKAAREDQAEAVAEVNEANRATATEAAEKTGARIARVNTGVRLSLEQIHAVPDDDLGALDAALDAGLERVWAEAGLARAGRANPDPPGAPRVHRSFGA